MPLLDSKVIAVIGGGGLLGKDFCSAIAREGGTVAVADRDERAAGETAGGLAAVFPGTKTMSIGMDITSETSIREGIGAIERELGPIDAVVNAAYPRNREYGKKLEEVGYDSFCENLSLNLGGYFLAMKEFALHFKPRGTGNIVNISSVYGVVAPRFSIYEGTPMTMPVEYAAIKSGLIHLTKYMVKYFGGTRIRFNCISPGGIRDGQPDSFLESYNRLAQSKGMLDPGDVSGTLVFLLSDLSAWINGQNIIVDDGWSL